MQCSSFLNALLVSLKLIWYHAKSCLLQAYTHSCRHTNQIAWGIWIEIVVYVLTLEMVKLDWILLSLILKMKRINPISNHLEWILCLKIGLTKPSRYHQIFLRMALHWPQVSPSCLLRSVILDQLILDNDSISRKKSFRFLEKKLRLKKPQLSSLVTGCLNCFSVNSK